MAVLVIFFFAKMSEKALMTARKREYRTTQRERYRSSVFIVEYTQRKHKRIYEEAYSFYQKLVKRYPTKTKLTTCPEFKTWEATIEKDHDPATQMAPIIISSSTTTPIDLSSQHNIQLNIPLMDSNEVQEMQDTLVFQDIYPSLLKEINPETLEQIISEIQESDVNIQSMDSSEIQESDVNIQSMDSSEVQGMRDTPVFQDIYPSLLKEINPETLEQIISEIQESDVNIQSMDSSEIQESDVNIQSMDSSEVQGMRDTPVFQDIHPPMLKEINPETLDQIISEIEESDVNIFNYDEDINDILNIEINNSMNELSPLEKELLMH